MIEELMQMTSPALTALALKSPPFLIYDFNRSLGDTIKQKYEVLYSIVFAAVNDLCIYEEKSWPMWMYCSPEISSIFEVCSSREKFEPADPELFGKYEDASLAFAGTVQDVQLYKNPMMSQKAIIVGCDSPKYEKIRKIEVRNMIW